MNKLNRHSLTCIFLAGLASGCSGPEQEENGGSHSADPQDEILVPLPPLPGEQEQNQLSWKEFTKRFVAYAQGPIVGQRELDDTKWLFSYCFRLDANQPGVEPNEFVIPWDEFAAMVPEHPLGWERAIRFHYGLNNPTAELGWSYWFINPRSPQPSMEPIEPYDTMIHQWVDGRVVSADMADWINDHQTSALKGTYFRHMEINRLKQNDPNNYWDDVRKGDMTNTGDPHSCTLLWDHQMNAMYDDNRVQFDKFPEDVKLVISFTGDWRHDKKEENRYIAHTVTAHLRIDDGSGQPWDLISDNATPSSSPRFNRGVNYGTLCPYRCAHIERH